MINALYDMYGDFEWDEQKNDRNKRKHGFSFAAATEVFLDPYVVIEFDRFMDGEERFHATGAAANALLLVVHCNREYENGQTKTRIISARAANKRERQKYQAALVR